MYFWVVISWYNESKWCNYQALIDENENSFDLSKYPKSKECVLSRYICDKIQIDYLVEITRDIVFKILILIDGHFRDELDQHSDISKIIFNNWNGLVSWSFWVDRS